ncbi:SIR2 family NAD-dependent protein deacylase [Hyphomonas pacifica]|uniref:protein acetyllysine N-acetyltransferase n=1 Tax=Hyphomonas pacifica TaxID=1280941 RepID=A0A062U9S9_9PROT|nr:Sir2 family NAD-dependent protein deacetylase [Hyphomonas pacifica]KCZ52900.1 NAD-dependent deacetylase [Hyphomonas pacifica]RAN35363.1 NAD-dependent deacetylase [Hyphomonas pacifica]RAN38244.1 NAD-dependent deacetylase [Hyphomonas pacifica]
MTDAGRLARYISDARRVMVFTGAGISTESGIPDFRSPGGVWSKMSPIYFQDFVASRDARRESWRRVFNRTEGWTGAEPNVGHYAVADLVKRGKISSVVTQNVDNLHQTSGVPDDKVIEIHGNASYAKCLQCGKRYEFEPLRKRWENDEDLTCIFCTGLLKNATVSFGQAMPEQEMLRASEEALLCDLCIVLGSSLVVYPAAAIPIEAKRNGARLIIVNREPTDQDPFADLVLHKEIGSLMTDTMAILDK